MSYHLNRYLLLLCFYLCAQTPLKLLAEPLHIPVHAESAILINADTGAVLYEKDAHTQHYPASITKIVTAAYILHTHKDSLDAIAVADLDAIASITEEKRRSSNYTCPAYWLVPGSSHIGIKRGEKLSLRDLLFGMMIPSGSDAANVLAQHVGGTIPDFMEGMNAYVREIGCQNSTFFNPHGLHHPQHQTTAFDMALITREAMRDALFREMVSTVQYMRPKTNMQEAITLIQTNRLLRKGKLYYPKAIGVKTGATSIAGNTLVAAAKHEDRTLIAVLLKTKEREDMFLDAIRLFETAFNQPKERRVLLKAGPQKFALDLAGAKTSVFTYLKDEISIEYFPAEEPQVKCLLHWIAKAPPIAKDEVVGELHLQIGDEKLVKKISLLAQADVSATWLWSLQNLFGKNALFKWGALVLVVLAVVGFICSKFWNR